MSEEPREIPYFYSLEEYIEWVESNPDPRSKIEYNPHLCPRHWWPGLKAFQEGLRSNGAVLSVVLAGEAFARLPEDFPKNADATALNSFFQNTTEPTCCWLGDEKMDWLWWLLQEVDLCEARGWPHPEGRSTCMFPKGHSGEHQYRLPNQSIFNFMERFPKC